MNPEIRGSFRTKHYWKVRKSILESRLPSYTSSKPPRNISESKAKALFGEMARLEREFSNAKHRESQRIEKKISKIEKLEEKGYQDFLVVHTRATGIGGAIMFASLIGGIAVATALGWIKHIANFEPVFRLGVLSHLIGTIMASYSLGTKFCNGRNRLMSEANAGHWKIDAGSMEGKWKNMRESFIRKANDLVHKVQNLG